MKLNCLKPLLYAFVLCLLTACSSPEPTPKPPLATTPTPATLSPTQLRDDLELLYRSLQEAHYDLYARRSKTEYDARYRELHAALDTPLQPDAARREFQRFVAYGNVAHARIDPPAASWEAFRVAGGAAFPLFLQVNGARVEVRRNYSGSPDIAIGDAVHSINGVPALEWLAPYRGLVSADNDYLAYTQLETALPMLIWWQDGPTAQFEVVLSANDGAHRTLQLQARTREQFAAAEAAGLSGAVPAAQTREARLLDDGIAYLRPGPFYDNRPEAEHPWDPSAFRNFIDSAFAQFNDAKARALLIDLRDNPGGDNSFSDPMIAWFADEPFRFSPEFDIRVSAPTIEANAIRLKQNADPESISVKLAAAYAASKPGDRVSFPIPLVEPRAEPRYTGSVYLLINRRSYSNTVMVAATVQDYGFGRILGEETADLATTYGSGESFTLPASGFDVFYPKARILRPSGDAAARGVIPDIAIPAPSAHQDQDSVLNAALRIVAAGPAGNSADAPPGDTKHRAPAPSN